MDIRDRKALEKLKKLKIDILINNAGLGEVLQKYLIQKLKI